MPIILNSMSLEQRKKLISDLHDFYIPYRDNLDLSKDATFGCEIEFNMRGYDGAYIKKLNEEGYVDTAYQYMYGIGYGFNWKVIEEINNRIEIVSDVLTDESRNWHYLKEILDFIVNKGAYENGLGGSHIHVGYQILKGKYDFANRFLKLYACYENEIIRFTNGEYYFDRIKFDVMCERCKSLLIRYLKNYEVVGERNLSNLLCAQTTSVSFPTYDFFTDELIPSKPLEYNKSNTIEFRSPALTLNPIIWQNNINFFLRMLESVTKPEFDIELLEKRYQIERYSDFTDKSYIEEKALELCDLVFDNDFDKYCFLRQYYKDFNDPEELDLTKKSTSFCKIN